MSGSSMSTLGIEAAMLTVERINVFYGDSHIIRDASLEVGSNEAISAREKSDGLGSTNSLSPRKAPPMALPVKQHLFRSQ